MRDSLAVSSALWLVSALSRTSHWGGARRATTSEGGSDTRSCADRWFLIKWFGSLKKTTDEYASTCDVDSLSVFCSPTYSYWVSVRYMPFEWPSLCGRLYANICGVHRIANVTHKIKSFLFPWILPKHIRAPPGVSSRGVYMPISAGFTELLLLHIK